MICKILLCVLAVVFDKCLFCAPEFGSKHYDALKSLLHLWVVSFLRLVILYGISLLTLGYLKPVLKRILTVHCLLAPVYETVRVLTYGWPKDSASGPLGGTSAWLLCTACAAAAALFWEATLPDPNGQNGEESKKRARVLFMRVVGFYKPDFLLLFGAFVFLSLAVLWEMFIPFYTGKVIDILGSQYQWDDFRSAILFLALYSLGSSFSAGCRGGLFMCSISSFTCRIKVKLFGALVKQEIGLFDAIKTGDVTSRLSKDTTLMGRTVALNVNVLLRTLIKTGGMLSLMVNLSWKLTLLMLMETPITGLLQSVYDSHYQRLSQEVQNSMARVNEAAGEAVGGIRVVRSFNTLRGEARCYDDKLMETHNLKMKRDTVRAVYLLVRRLTTLGMQVIMLYYGRLFIQRGQMTTGNLVSFILYQGDLADNIRTVIYIFGDMLNSVGAADKVFEYLDREPKVSTKGTLEPEQLHGHVQFQNLTFSYPSNLNHKVLQDFSLELLPGQVTALVGPSGGGKSTCVSLLERFYQPQQGEILLDGKPLHTYEHHYLHRKVAMVGQEPVLFAGSVRDNIAYGLEDCPLEKVQEAARMANAHHFICQMENGYNTDVGEGGGQLSGGQKQRIAIARALIRDPQVLILDEVTSALDTESEHAVLQTLANNPSMTLLVIAHRLRTIEEADRIVVIGEGKVQEQGTHQELMDRKGTYYKLREKLFIQGDSQP